MADQYNWQIIHYSFEINQMYLAEVEHFWVCVDSKETPTVTMRQGFKTLRVALAACVAAEERKWVKLA